mmetsp:Transcript_35986/g.83564  ORF Transcript_35986/g.83564 Transcript_35986/m.83564 type:complete len:228 (+) Transcript_35986:32-715(+)
MAFVPHPIVETSFDESTASRTQAAEDEADELDPPENFGMVFKGVYRSGYPTKKNFPFLEKLKLKSIIFMCEEEYADGNRAFLDRNGIKLLQHGVTGNKEPFVDINEEIIYRALQRILDVRNHPLLIHCNKGKHRTGCVVGCLRAQNHWSMTAVFDEYRSFAGTKVPTSAAWVTLVRRGRQINNSSSSSLESTLRLWSRIASSRRVGYSKARPGGGWGRNKTRAMKTD